MIPFTRDQFFGAFSAYNQGVWPAQIALLLAAVAATTVAWRRAPSGHFVAAVLSLLWVWMSAAYHVAFLVDVTPAAYVFGALFALQGGAIAWYGIRTGRLEIARPSDRTSRMLGWVLVIYAIVLYPLIGLLAGHRYPAMPTFGLPCPTTVFTLGLFAWSTRPIPWALLVVPLGWSAVATSAALALGVVEDLMLPVAAAAVAIDQLRRNRLSSAPVSGA